MVKKFRTNGKLLLTSEYFVLDGALALAIPTQYGQQLEVLTQDNVKKPYFTWSSFEEKNNKWFEGVFQKKGFDILKSTDSQIAQRLQEILLSIEKLNPDFKYSTQNLIAIRTHLEFPRLWGLGSSSTLIAMLAQYAAVNPYNLLKSTFGGSGYDLACATHQQAISYQLPGPKISTVDFNPSFKENLFFVYLNQKQNSREGIKNYRSIGPKVLEHISTFSELSRLIINCKELANFVALMKEHESLVSTILQIPKVKNYLFSDYVGMVKSLGAWGGDFVMVSGDNFKKTKEYFNKKGYQTVIPYQEMVIQNGEKVVR